jgi:hypothetical protein
MQQTTLAAGGGLGIRQGPRGVWNGDVWQAEPNMATAMRSVGPQHSKHYTNWTVRRPSAAARLLLVHVRNSVQYVSVFHIPRLQELTVLYLTTLSIFKIILFKFSFSLSGNTVRCALIGWLRRRKEAPYRACVRVCVSLPVSSPRPVSAAAFSSGGDRVVTVTRNTTIQWMNHLQYNQHQRYKLPYTAHRRIDTSRHLAERWQLQDKHCKRNSIERILLRTLSTRTLHLRISTPYVKIDSVK